jgi:hypothetical protein
MSINDLPVQSSLLIPFDEKKNKAEDLIIRWCSEKNSNLLVLMGGVGSGKTTIISKIFQSTQKKHTYHDYSKLIERNRCVEGLFENLQIEKDQIIVIDNFDSVNSMNGIQVEHPDLRGINKLVERDSSVRIVVLTRRCSHITRDEFWQQLTSDRLSNFAFNNPYVLRLLPWDVMEIERHGYNNNDQSLVNLSYFLSGIDPIEISSLTTPLFTQMLLSIVDTLEPARNAPLITNIYDRYFNNILGFDFDRQQSKIPRSIKQIILSDLAFDIFSGKTVSTIVFDRVTQRVIETVKRDHCLRVNKDLKKYEWTSDFLTTNHIFEEENNSIRQTDKRFKFIHQSFYEYFVAISIVNKINGGKALDVKLENLSIGVFDSFILSFVKSMGGQELIKAIHAIVAREQLSTADRLILLFLLEDDSSFNDIINKTPIKYLDSIDSLQASMEKSTNFFLKKMMLYQLVIAGRYSAEFYVNELMMNEDRMGLYAEEFAHSSQVATTQQLLSRLKNPCLCLARSITVYRLGQLADKSAILSLENFASNLDSKDKFLLQQLKISIAKIKERAGII